MASSEFLRSTRHLNLRRFEGSCSGWHIEICKGSCDGSFGRFGTRHLRGFCYGNCKVSCDTLDVLIWEVLAMAPARFPAMDRMMETARVLVMVVWLAAAMDRKWKFAKAWAMASATPAKVPAMVL